MISNESLECFSVLSKGDCMYRSKKPLIWLALVSAVFLSESAARADFQLSIYDNGSLVASSTSSSTTLSGTSADFSYLVVAGVSNTPGSATNGAITIETLQVYSLNGNTDKFSVVLSSNDFTLPAAPGVLSSSGTVTTTGTPNGSVNLQAFVDTSNTLWGTQSTLTNPSGPDVTSTTQQSSTIVSGSLTNAAAFGNTSTGFAGATPYSITNEYNFTSTSTGSSSNYLSFQGTAAVTATPAPSGAILAASALPVLAGGWFLRRRKQLQLA
jgi:hypothetical protein